MSRRRETRICPVCHCLLWEEDFLEPRDLETWEGSTEDPVPGATRNAASRDAAGIEIEELVTRELVELILEILLAPGLDEILEKLPKPSITVVIEPR